MKVWKPVLNFEDYYEVSSWGEIRNKKTGRILKQHLNGEYLKVKLSKEGKQYTFYSHRVVAYAFHPKPENCRVVNHIDGIGTHNSACNLEWVTDSENAKHSIERRKK